MPEQAPRGTGQKSLRSAGKAFLGRGMRWLRGDPAQLRGPGFFLHSLLCKNKVNNSCNLGSTMEEAGGSVETGRSQDCCCGVVYRNPGRTPRGQRARTGRNVQLWLAK